MRQEHNRVSRPQIMFNNGIWGQGFSLESFGGSITITQDQAFTLTKMSVANNKITKSATSNISSSYDEFRCGTYLRSTNKIDVTNISKINLSGAYSFTSGSVHGDYHFRRLYLALLSSATCYVAANGTYLSHNKTPSEANQVPQYRLTYDVGKSGKFNMSLDVSNLSGSYYIAAIMLLKSCSVTGRMDITGFWME